MARVMRDDSISLPAVLIGMSVAEAQCFLLGAMREHWKCMIHCSHLQLFPKVLDPVERSLLGEIFGAIVLQGHDFHINSS
jgi:hypothetical protein